MIEKSRQQDAASGQPYASQDLIVSSQRERYRAWIRPLIAVLVSAFLYDYVSHAVALVWLATILLFEAVGFVIRRYILKGDLRFAWAGQANTLAVSLCWVTHAVLLWRAGGVIPDVAAVMDLFTVALYAAIGSYQNLKLFLLLVLPQLAALAVLLISYLLQHATPLVAASASLATIGACATIIMNGLSMHRAEAGLRRSNVELARLAQSAQAASQAKTDFLATMSHEIRTPLNGMLGMVQAMARDDLPGLQRERLELIGESGETLMTILNDILDLSKIEAGELRLEPAAFDLEALALGVRKAFAHIAAGKGLEFSVGVEEAARGTYWGDPVRIRQILYNLIANAMKFTASGSVDVTISRSLTGLRFIVADTGIGMSVEQLERLFDKFTQADSSITRRFGGTGLGLSICRQLCRAMGGEVIADSELGGGSRFTVDLPLTRTDDAGRERRLDRSAEAPVFDYSTLRVLAADDNRVNRLVLSTLLRQAGIDPKLVANGEEAVAEWEQNEWDLILMDVQMPVMDGMTAARRIRLREAETGRSPTTIVALTANAMDHQLEACRAAGMSDFVAKPIDVEALFAAIARGARA